MLRNLNYCWLIILILCLGSQRNLYSQTKECEIGFFDGSSLNRTKMMGQYEDLILVSDAESYKILNIRKISSIKFDNGTYLWTGVGIGAAVGFVGGVVLYEIMSHKKKPFLTKDASVGIGVIITIPCAIIGGFIGNIYRNIDSYDMSQMETYLKAKEIKFIMKDHSIWK